MKKLLSLLLIAGMVSFVACGPKALSKEELEKKLQDSINTADSIAQVNSEIEIKKMQDSIAKLDAKKNKKTITASFIKENCFEGDCDREFKKDDGKKIFFFNRQISDPCLNIEMVANSKYTIVYTEEYEIKYGMEDNEKPQHFNKIVSIVKN